MRRSYVISDLFFRFTHCFKRNVTSVLVYSLFAAVFLVIGIAVGVKIDDKTEYVLRNGAVVFRFLRGDINVVVFFFYDAALSLLYCAFSCSMFFTRALSYLSFAPFMYKSYALGLRVSAIAVVFSGSSVPMLLVFYIPACLVDIAICCMLSFKCRSFRYECGKGMPSKPDIKFYYSSCVPFFIATAACSLIKAFSAALFGSALIGVI